MTGIERRIAELEKKVKGDFRTEEEIEAERIMTEKYEAEAARRLREKR